MSHNNAVNNLFLNQKMVQVTTDYQVQEDDVILELGVLLAPITITLPTPAAKNRGKSYLIKDSSGGSSINPVSLQTTSALIDGATRVVLSQNGTALKVFSDGVNYFTYANFLKKGAAGSWKKYATTVFTPGATVVQTTPTTDWNTKLFSLSSRLDISALNSSIIPIDLQVDSQNLTFIQPGTYSVRFKADIFGYTSAVCQLVRNDNQILLACPTQHYYGYKEDIRPLEVLYIGHFTAGDHIDVRFGLHTKGNAFTFFVIQYDVIQLIPSL